MKTLEIDSNIPVANYPRVPTWYQINAKTHPFYSVAGRINYLMPVLMNINANRRNKGKIAEN